MTHQPRVYVPLRALFLVFYHICFMTRYPNLGNHVDPDQTNGVDTDQSQHSQETAKF